MKHTVIHQSAEAYRAELDAEAEHYARELGITRKSFAEQVAGRPPGEITKAIAEASRPAHLSSMPKAGSPGGDQTQGVTR